MRRRSSLLALVVASLLATASAQPNKGGGGMGDMLIELAVETPVNLTSRQRDLLREFEKLSEENNPEGSSFFQKVKGFWEGMGRG